MTCTHHRLSSYDINKLLNVKVKSWHVLSYASGYFWIKTNLGVFTLDSGFKHAEWKQELDRFNIINVLSDRQGNTWLLTEDQGCIQYCSTPYQFQPLAPNIDPADGYMSAFITWVTAALW